MKTLIRSFTLAVLAIAVAGPAFCQQGPGGGGGGRGGRGGGGRGNWDPARMTEFMMNRTKESIQATDEEWQVLSPVVEKILNIRRDTMMMMGRRRGGPGGQDNQDVPNELAELRAALEDPNTPADVIKTKLEAYRKLVQSKEEELAAARDELRQLLTVRQEAQLVLDGTLD